jgi:lipid-binding SYLF domain-containing protein
MALACEAKANLHPLAFYTIEFTSPDLQLKAKLPENLEPEILKMSPRGIMKKVLLSMIVLLSMCAASFAADEPRESKAQDRVQAAADVLDDIQGAPDKGIPEEVLGSAECVAVVPSMLKGGFIVGAKYGRGLASCRTPKGWSAPAFFVVTGGSVGFQIGGQAVDLVMLIMNKDGMKHLLSSEFALGADASVAAGPVGRHAEGNTDWKLRAEVLTYSRARGLFAGVSLNGAAIKQDKDSTREFYGRMVPFRTSLTGEIDPPAGANAFLTSLAKWAQEAAK